MPGKPPRTRQPAPETSTKKAAPAKRGAGAALVNRDGTTPAAKPDEKLPVYRRFLNEVLLGGAARIMNFVGLFFLCFASIFLFNAWQFGPKVLVEAERYRAFTAHVDAPVRESWLALEVDTGAIRNAEFWRASALASPCAVVEYGGDWGAPLRRAFCGNRFGFHDSYQVHALDSMAPDVPFAWARDEHGFIVPEIRLDERALRWLAAAPAHTFMHRQWPAQSELDWLRLTLDRPVESAVIGWTAKPAVLPLSFDPAHPGDALPTGMVRARRDQEPSWAVVVFCLVIGVPIWMIGMRWMPIVGGLAPWPQRIASLALLATVPWWADQFPRAVARFSTDAGSVIATMFGDLTALDRMLASEPDEATLAHGSRLTWRIADSAFADTLGTFKLEQPVPAPADQDAALAALAESVAAQTRARSDANRAALFGKLERDKLRDLRAAGIAFLPAAKEALLDPQSEAGVRRAARRFLTEWVTAPTELVDQHTPAYREWGVLQRSLADVPVPEIAIMVGGTGTGK